jgi:tRNA (guanine-N7-)-methyltransferase
MSPLIFTLDNVVIESGCQYFIKRKNRHCSHRAAPLSQFCTEHSEENLSLAFQRNIEKREKYEERMRAHVATIPDNMIKSETCAVLLSMIARIDGSEKNILLPDTTDSMPHTTKKRSRNKRVSAPKRMANPYSQELTPDLGNMSKLWDTVFSEPTLPLHIDVGCAKGGCIERLSRRPHRLRWNHLGLEIRADLLQEKSKASNSNLHFIACNFLASAVELLQTLPVGVVRLISIQFPDPWRREKHLKRLIIQPSLVDALAKFSTRGAAVYFSSDCEQISLRMKDQFDISPYFEPFANLNSFVTLGAFLDPLVDSDRYITADLNDGAWLMYNPLSEPSERELVCETHWRRVWRCIFVRNGKEFVVPDTESEIR